jgi:MerR family transcriptional regulator, light-induced transcriptional regulator
MNTFTIRDVENLSGIKAHTLRIWELRHGLICPKRKPGNHRLYDNEDLKYLLRIAYLYHHGHKISTIAKMSDFDICQAALCITEQKDAMAIYLNQMLDASIDFDLIQFDKILHNVIVHFGIEKSFIQIIFPFLEKIGLLWLTGNIIPAQEHFASTLIAKKLHIAISGLDHVPSGERGRVILFTPQGELHEISLLFMHYMLKKNNIHTAYLGKNIDLDELIYYCAHRQASHLYFHQVTQLGRYDPQKYVDQLLHLFPDKQIVFSGSLNRRVRIRRERLWLLKSIDDMQDFAAGNYRMASAQRDPIS